MSDEQKIQERITTVRGEPVTIYSADGVIWNSDEHKAAKAAKRHAKLMADLSKSIMRSDTFKHRDQPIGKRSKRRIEAEKKYATQTENGG